MTDLPHIKDKAMEIANLGREMPPSEFLAALAVATAAAISSCWPKEEHDNVIDTHFNNVVEVVAHIDNKKSEDSRDENLSGRARH